MSETLFAKALAEAVIKFWEKPFVLKIYLNDKRIPAKEKQLLKSMSLIRENRPLSAIEILNSSYFEQTFQEGIRLLLLGISHNNISDWDQAIIFLDRSKELLQRVNPDSSSILFLVYYNIYNTFLNLRNKKRCEEISEKILNFPTHTRREEIIKHKVQLSILTLKEKFEETPRVVAYLTAKLATCKDYLKTSILYDLFDFYVATNDFKNAAKIHLKMKCCRTFYISESYIYIGILMSFINSGQFTYYYKDQFAFGEILFMQLQYIESRNRGDKSADLIWQSLQLLVPTVFLPSGKYNGGRDLFHHALNKIETKKEQSPSIEHKKTGDNHILDLFANGAHVSKNELFFFIYGTYDFDKEEQKKLSAVLNRLKKKHQINFKFFKGHYYLVSEK